MWKIVNIYDKILKKQKEAVKIKLKSLVTKPWALIFFSAVLSALPLTFEGLFLLSWVSFVPLFYVIFNHSGDKWRTCFGRGFLFGFIYHACIYYWFLWFYPLDYAGLSGGASLAVVALAWFGISAVHGILWCIPLLLCRSVQKITKNPLLLAFVCIVGIMTAQKLTGLSELSFPWTRLSLGQYKATALIQGASLFGIDGVDMLILVINALIALCLVYPAPKRKVAAIVAAAIFVANLAFGVIRLNSNEDFIGELNVLTVQGSVAQSDKWASDGDKICYDTYSSLTKENVTDKTDIIIWPESAVPKVYRNENALKQYKKLSAELDIPILAGVLLRNDDGHTNNAALINGDGVEKSYAKRQLVPFGEYMPYQATLSKIFPMLTELNIVEDDYVPGSDTAIMQVGNGKLGNIICFESIYPSLARESVLDGAEVLVEVTNDSWLKDSPAMYQHLAHGVFRSVESGRYLVRSANSGVSAVIDNRGRVVSQLDVNVQGVITETIYFSTEKTLYTILGDILFPTFSGGVMIWIIAIFIKRKKAADN